MAEKFLLQDCSEMYHYTLMFHSFSVDTNTYFLFWNHWVNETAVHLSEESYMTSHKATPFDTISNVWRSSFLPTFLEADFHSDQIILNNSSYRVLQTGHRVSALDHHELKGLSGEVLLLHLSIAMGRLDADASPSNSVSQIIKSWPNSKANVNLAKVRQSWKENGRKQWGKQSRMLRRPNEPHVLPLGSHYHQEQRRHINT